MASSTTQPLLSVDDKEPHLTLQVDTGAQGPHQDVVPCKVGVENLSYYLGKGEKETKILNNVTTAFLPGNLTAVMGTSDKLAVLSLLSGQLLGRK